jgi:ABC-type polysaccharide/polyol phosphate export permease
LIAVAGAVVLRELRVQRRYPISMVNLVLLTPLYEMALPSLLLGSAFLVDGAAVGLERMVGTADLPGWLGLGLLVASMLVGTVWAVTWTLQSDRATGVLEHSWSTPASREAFVVGAVLTGTAFTVAANAILLAFAIVVLHASYAPWGLLCSLPVLAMTLLGNCGFGYLAAAATLIMRRPGALLDPLTTLVATFSGVAFPLTLLPGPARLPTYVLPTTWGLDLIRGLTLHSRLLLPLPVELVALAGSALIILQAGRRAFAAAERRIRMSGTLSQF